MKLSGSEGVCFGGRGFVWPLAIFAIALLRFFRFRL